MITNGSVKHFSFFNGVSIGDKERVCQTHQLLQWKEYWWTDASLLEVRVWWSRMGLSNTSASSMEGVPVIKERVCPNSSAYLMEVLLQWKEYWWSGTCLSNGTASSMEGVPVIKNVSVKLFCLFNGGVIGDQERVILTLQLHQWREYWWSRMCL